MYTVVVDLVQRRIPSLDDIPPGCWAERLDISCELLGWECWKIVRAALPF